MPSSKINVAVAGVTSGLGNAIATALVTNPSVSLTLLTRASSSSTIPEVIQPLVNQGAILRPIDYTSIESVTKGLQGVHTVISTLSTVAMLTDTTPADNLLKGAIAAGVKRFAPSEFAITKEANYTVEYFRSKAVYWEKVIASGMEYTAFRNGIFLDYFAKGSSLYKGPLRMATFVVDVEERKAEIPGTGNEKVTLTTLADIGKFVSAAVTLDKWPEELGMSGETTTFNEVVRTAEEVVGKKFDITYLTPDELKKRFAEGVKTNNLMKRISAEAYMSFVEGQGEIKNPYLNEVTDVKPVGVREFLQTYWKI